MVKISFKPILKHRIFKQIFLKQNNGSLFVGNDLDQRLRKDFLNFFS